MHTLAITILTLACIHAYAYGDSHFACKQMDEIFTSNSAVPPEYNSPRNRPGKKGEKGERGGNGLAGEKGQKGESFIVDYARINATIKEFVKEMLKEFQKRNATDVAEEPKNPVKADCPISYDKKCYVPEVETYADEATAHKICAAMSGHLANIYSERQFQHVTKAIQRDYLGKYSARNLRTGLTVNTQNFETKITDGSPARYLPWGYRYPKETPGHTSVFVEVGTSRSYIHNREPSWSPYTLCEIEL